MKTIVKWSLSALVVAAVVLVGGFYLVTKSDMFLEARQAYVGAILENAIDQPVTVQGVVDISFNDAVDVVITDALISQDVALTGIDYDQYFRTIAFRFPYSQLIGAGGGISRFQLSEAAITIVPPQRDLTDETVTAAEFEQSFTFIPTSFLTNRVSEDLLISDFTVRYRNRKSGWDETLVVDMFRTTRAPGARDIKITARGTLNDSPFSIEATVESPLATKNPKDVALAVQLELPGLSVAWQGQLDVSEPVARQDVVLTAVSSGLSEFLDALEIRTEIDATAMLSARLSGELGALQLAELDLAVNAENGVDLTVTGEIADIGGGTGFALAFDSNFTPLSPRGGDPASVFDAEILGFRGRIEGDIDALRIADGFVKTNVAVVEYGDVGPIEIGRIVKDEDDRIGLEAIRIRTGPIETPYLDLTGRIGRFLPIGDAEFSGSFRLPTTRFFDIEVADPRVLGWIEGSLIASDSDGSFGLDTLTASSVETDLLTLEATIKADYLRFLDEVALDVLLRVPNLGDLLVAIDRPVKTPVGLFGFEGEVSLADESLAADGTATIESSAVHIDIDIAPGKGGTFVAGKIGSQSIRLSDFSGFLRFIREVEPEAPIDVDLAEEIIDTTEVAIKIDIAKLIGTRRATGRVNGTLAYKNDTVRLAPLSIGYLGGTISGDFATNLANTPLRHSAKGRIDKWTLGRFLSEFGVTSPVTGSLSTSFDVSAAGNSLNAIVDSLTGKMAVSLWNGEIQGRILDLTGLNLITWLFVTDSQNNTSRLVCAVAPLSFKNGRATSNKLVIETDNVQIVGGGTIDLRADTLDLAFVPRPKKKQAVDIVTPFSIAGPIGNPTVTTQGTAAGRAVGEILTLPLNVLGRIFAGDQARDVNHKPCVVTPNTGPK